MATSLGDLLDTAAEVAAEPSRNAFDRAAAAGALGHLGRALALLRTDGVSRATGDLRERQVAALAQSCLDLAATAPSAESRLTRMAAGAAHAVVRARQQLTVEQRWAIATAIVDTIAPFCAVLATTSDAGPTTERLATIAHQSRRVQQSAALNPPTRGHYAILDHPIPSYWNPGAEADVGTRLREATAALIDGTRPGSRVLTIAEVLAVSMAAETLSQAAACTDTRPVRSRGVADITAADGWAAVRATLRPFNDGTRRRQDDAPRHIEAARVIYHTVHDAGSALDAHRDGPMSAVADATQHLPLLAEQLHRAASGWPATHPVLAYATDLPYREGRASAALAGFHSGGLVRADAVDLAPVTDAIHSAGVLSTVLASDVGRRNVSSTARRAWSAHQTFADQPDGPERLSDAKYQAYRYLQQTHGPRSGLSRAR